MDMTREAHGVAASPELPTGVIPVELPPDQPEGGGIGNLFVMLLPMVGSMGVMIFMSMSQASNPRMMLTGGGMVLAMVLMFVFNAYRQIGGHRQKIVNLRREYLAYLSETRKSVRAVTNQQRAFHRWHLPSPDSLVLIAHEGTRRWERTGSDPNVLLTRIGDSSQPLAMSLEVPELPPLANPDVVCYSAMNRFVGTHNTVHELPFGVPLGDFSHVEIIGDESMGYDQLRAMTLHLATFVPPSAFKVAILCSEARRPMWEWAKWLPHCASSESKDAVGASRMIVSSQAELESLLGDAITQRPQFMPRSEGAEWPHVLIIVDDVPWVPMSPLSAREGASGVTVVKLLRSWDALTSMTTLRLGLYPSTDPTARGTIEMLLLDRSPMTASPDRLSLEQAEATARRLAHMGSESSSSTSSTPVGRSDPKRSQDLMELLRVGDIRDFDPDLQWTRRSGRDFLKVPFAVTPEGVPVYLDIKEAAQEGMGPHGVLIGATGSGKSEVLRTLVLAMTLTHSPEQLNLVLVDFKGGATFAGMSALPHVSAMISNLESELFLVDRMQEALQGEMVRRQELLRDAGNYANIGNYEKARLQGEHEHPPLPSLFIVLDEFSELLAAKPEFIETFVSVGRLGRSLGVHLLLASQRLDEGRMRGLESHLSYRIGLKTFNVSESRQLLGVPDAATLPPYPGVGYLKTSDETMTRFRASYVAAPPPPRKALTATSQAGASDTPIRILPFTSTPVLAREEYSVPVEETTVTMKPGDERWEGKTEMDIAVEKMKGKGPAAHKVWLDPLDLPDTLDQFMYDLNAYEGLGFMSPNWRQRGPLRVPLGTVDLPLEQRRQTLEVDLSGAAGHMAIVGAPLSGKSTLLRTLMSALSLVHTPQEVQFYVMDFGGGTFASFRNAAHVAGVVTRDVPEGVERLLDEIEAIIADRETYFRVNGIESITAYRQGRAEGRWDDGYGDVFLMVDGWGTLRTEFQGMDQRIEAMMQRSLSYGVHLIVTATRWNDFRMSLQELLVSFLELRLGSPSDSRHGRKVGTQVPEGKPGRGLTQTGHHFLGALPRIDADSNVDTLSDGVQHMVDQINGYLPFGPGPKLRELPDLITVDEVAKLAPLEAGEMRVGVESTRLAGLELSPAASRLICVFGEAKSGKTNFLRNVVHQVISKYTDKQVAFMVFDPRMTLQDVVPEEYLFSHTTMVEELEKELPNVLKFLERRFPTGKETREQRMNRSWWTGREVWLLVDDYELAAAQNTMAFADLRRFIPRAADVGLNVVVARRSGGANRALGDAVFQPMLGSEATVVLLSTDPTEGLSFSKIKGVKAQPGRAQVITSDQGVSTVQLSWVSPDGE